MGASDHGSAALRARSKDRGWTPGKQDVGPLLDLLGADDEDAALDAERALLRIEGANLVRVATAAVERARASTRPLRGRLTRLAGRLAERGADDARAWLVEAVRDADPKTRRAAARALGKLPRTDEVERALLAAWDEAASDDDRRALAEPLGKLGSKAARERLAALKGAGGETARRAGRAEVMLDREEARREEATVDRSRAMDGPVVVRFHTRAGLEEVVADELGEPWRPRVAGPGAVEARLEGPIGRALDVRTATDVGFPLEPANVEGGLAETIVRAITGERAMRVFHTYTERAGRAPIRFRLAFARPGPGQAGRRRALAWRCAELVREATRELVNDPRRSTWEVLVDDAGDHVALELLPRGFDDERFAYRRALVPASSSPQIAAALARVAPRRDDDVVWDPFVGAGAELVERAKLGPYARLVGTDLEPKAVEAARTNLAAAGVARATVELGDAAAFDPGPVTLVISNPPMGRRVQRGSHTDLLGRFVDHAAKVLVPGGALVWTVPEPRALNERASRAGLSLERAWTVDMGGFPASLSVFRRRS